MESTVIPTAENYGAALLALWTFTANKLFTLGPSFAVLVDLRKCSLRKILGKWFPIDISDDISQDAVELKIHFLPKYLMPIISCCLPLAFVNSWSFKFNLQAHIALNDIDAAVESFKHALELEPNDGLFSLVSTGIHRCNWCCIQKIDATDDLMGFSLTPLAGIKRELAAAKKKVSPITFQAMTFWAHMIVTETLEVATDCWQKRSGEEGIC